MVERLQEIIERKGEIKQIMRVDEIMDHNHEETHSPGVFYPGTNS